MLHSNTFFVDRRLIHPNRDSIVKSAFGLRRIMPSFATILSVAAFSLLAGCGQKGPLFMPKTGSQQTGAPSGTTVAPVPATVLPESEPPVSR